MTELDTLGHGAHMLVLCGMYFLAKSDKIGWLLRILGELGWVVIGLRMGMTSIWMWGLLFVAVDAKGYCTWYLKEINGGD